MESVLVLGGAEPSPLSGGQKKTARCGLMLPGNVGRDEAGQRDITALSVHARCAPPRHGRFVGVFRYAGIRIK